VRNKLLTTVIFSVTAILLSHTHSVYAAETLVYKCRAVKGQIVYQDRTCVGAKQLKLKKLKPLNRVSGLRKQELKDLEYVRKYLLQQQKLQQQ